VPVALRWKFRGSSVVPQAISYTRRSSAMVNSGGQNAVASGVYSSLDRARSTPSARIRRWSTASCRCCSTHRNQSHTCAPPGDLDRHFAGAAPQVRATFDAIVATVRAFGTIEVLPEKTRIALHARMSFAAFMPRQRWLAGHLVLARPVISPRFLRVEVLSPRNVVHSFRLSSPAEVDTEFAGWLAEAYQVGAQQHLGVIGWIREIVLDTADPHRLAGFWAALLGGTPVQWYPGWVTLEPPPHGQRLSFQGAGSAAGAGSGGALRRAGQRPGQRPAAGRVAGRVVRRPARLAPARAGWRAGLLAGLP
jgi:hypothetical protein